MPTTPPSFAPLTVSLVEFCQGLKTVLTSGIAQLAYDGHPATVFYGEQDRYPTVPAYCVEPVRKAREAINVQRIFQLDFTAQVIGYLAQVQKGEQIVRADIDVLGEKAEALINYDHTLGGLTQDCWVESVESGYAYKPDTKYKAVILTVRGTSRQGLPC